MSWLTEIRDKNQANMGNFVQKSNIGGQDSWLHEAQTEVTQKISEPTTTQKVFDWLGAAPGKTMKAVSDPESQIWKGPEGINEALASLAWQAVTFTPSIALGTVRMGHEKVRNLMVDESMKRSPQEILEKVQKSARFLPGLVDQPETKLGKAIVKPVGEFFHKLLKGPKKIAEDMTEYYGPNAGWLSEQVLTLGLFKVAHMKGKELHSGLSKITETIKKRKESSPRVKAKAEELSELMKDIKKAKEPTKYDMEFEKKVNEFESIMQAEFQVVMEKIIEKERLAEPALLPKEIQKPGELPIPPKVEIPEAAQRILDFAKAAKERSELDRTEYPRETQMLETPKGEKFETLDLERIQKNNNRRLKNLNEKQQVKEKIDSLEAGPKPKAKPKSESASDILARVPDLKTTGEAYAWGEKATESQIKDLEFAIKHSDQKIADLRAKKTPEAFEDAFAEAQHKQLYREAIERNQNIGSAKRKIEPKVKSESEPIKWRAQGKQFTDAVKSDLEIATDLGIFADIKNGLDAGKTRLEIIKDIKKSEYLKEDMKEFDYQATDLSKAIQAVDIIELGNPKAIESLHRSLAREAEAKVREVRDIEDAGIIRVDPETGRKPGVAEPNKRVEDLGTSDAIAAYRKRQEPIKFETGEIAKSRLMADRTAREQGLIGELVKNPAGEGWLIRPDKKIQKQRIAEMTKEWEKFLKEEAEREEPIGEEAEMSAWDTLSEIIAGERGEVKLEINDLKKIKDFLIRKKITGIEAQELLKAQGISDKQLRKIISLPTFVQKSNIGKPSPESKWLKPGQEASELLPARKLGKDRKAPRVSRGDARIIEQAVDIGAPLFSEKLRWKTSEGLLTSLGKPMRDLFFNKAIEGEKLASNITLDLIKQSNALKKTIPITQRIKSSERIDNYAMSRQTGGRERLEKQGETIVEKLTEKEQVVYDRLQEIYKELYTKINEKRKAIGEKKFPAVKNYATWAHDLAKLENVEKISMLAKMGTIQKGLDRMGKFPSKIDIKGRAPSMKGHEKFRGGPDTPGTLKLDAFDNFNRYAVMAGDVIGKSENLAYLHELLRPEFEMYKNANNTYNFLTEWLDYQKGQEPKWLITNPRTRRIMGKLSGNLAVSYLTYAPKSLFVQFSSLNNSIAEIGPGRIAQGFIKLLSHAEVKRASKESNVLTTRTLDATIMDALDQTALFPGKPGRVIQKVSRTVKQKGMLPLTVADSIIAYATWLGAEAKGKKIFPGELEKAQRYADDIVVRAQGSASRSARAPIQRSAAGKFVTTLQTFTIANWDYLTRQVLGIKNPDITKPQQVAKVMKWVAASTLISESFRQAGWRSPIPQPINTFQKSMEQTDDKVIAIKEAAIELLEFLPIYGGKYKFKSELAGPVMEQLVRLGGGDMTALPRLIGMPGFSTILKGYRAYKRDGTAADIMMGRYIEKPKKRTRGIGKL